MASPLEPILRNAEKIESPNINVGGPSSLVQPDTSMQNNDLGISSAAVHTGTTPLDPLSRRNNDVVEEQTEKKEKPQIIREVIIKERVKGRGCFGIFDTIRNLACSIFILIIVLIASIIAIIIFKPPFAVEPLKTFMNGSYKPSEASSDITYGGVSDYIDSQTKEKSGEVTFQLTEQQTTALIRNRTEEGLDIRTDSEKDKFIISVDTSENGKPLWVITELTQQSDDKLEITRLGLGRMNSPKALREFLKNQVFKVLGSFSKDLKIQNSEELLNSLLFRSLRPGATIKKVQFEQDVILVTVQL